MNRTERSEVVVCETGIDAAGGREAAAAPLSTACVRRLNEVKEVDQNSASWNQLLPWLRRVDTLRAGQVLTG